MDSQPQPSKTIVIEIKGGVLIDVGNLPEGYNYELIDHDISDCDSDEGGE